MKQVYVDTSAIVAAMNSKDKYHVMAKQIFFGLAEVGSILVMTNYVRAETHALLLQRAGRALALKFLEQGSFIIEWVDHDDESNAVEILRRFQDKDFSLTDATSFVVMERLGIDIAVSFDQHFRQYGWNVLSH